MLTSMFNPDSAATTARLTVNGGTNAYPVRVLNHFDGLIRTKIGPYNIILQT